MTASTIHASCTAWLTAANAGQWAGLSPKLPDSIRPDFGPGAVDARHGVVPIGATPWITNFNVLLDTSDMPAAKRLARALSARGGGIAGVEAMALAHSSGPLFCLKFVLQPVALKSDIISSDAQTGGDTALVHTSYNCSILVKLYPCSLNSPQSM